MTRTLPLCFLLIASLLAGEGGAQNKAPQLVPRQRLGKGRLMDFTYAPDGGKYAIATSVGVQVMEKSTLRQTAFLGDSLANEWINAVDWSPDGKYLALGAKSGTIAIWNMENLTRAALLEPQVGSIMCLDFGIDGQWLAFGDAGGRVQWCEWRMAKFYPAPSSHRERVEQVQIAADGHRVFSVSRDGTIKLWSMVYDAELATFTNHRASFDGYPHPFYTFALLQGGHYVVSGDFDGTATLWHVASGMAIAELLGHQAGVTAVAVSPDEKYLVTGSNDGGLAIRRAEAGGLNFTTVAVRPAHEKTITKIAFNPNSRYFASLSDDGSIKFWNVVNGALVRTISGYNSANLAIAFSPEGKLLAMGDNNNRIHVWDAAEAIPLRTLEGHKSEHKISKIEMRGGLVFESTGRGAVNDLTFAGAALISGSTDGTIRVWNTSTWQTDQIVTTNSNNDINGLALSGDDRLLGAVSEDSLRVWVWGDRQIAARRPAGGSSSFECMAASPKDSWFAAGRSAGDIVLLDLDAAQQTQALRGHNKAVTDLAFSPEGSTLYSAGEDALRVWEVAGGTQVCVLLAGNHDVSALAPLPHHYLVAGTEAGEIQLWDILSETLISTATAHSAGISDLALSTDKKHVASTSYDGTSFLWQIPALNSSSAEAAQRSLAWHDKVRQTKQASAAGQLSPDPAPTSSGSPPAQHKPRPFRVDGGRPNSPTTPQPASPRARASDLPAKFAVGGGGPAWQRVEYSFRGRVEDDFGASLFESEVAQNAWGLHYSGWDAKQPHGFTTGAGLQLNLTSLTAHYRGNELIQGQRDFRATHATFEFALREGYGLNARNLGMVAFAGLLANASLLEFKLDQAEGLDDSKDKHTSWSMDLGYDYGVELHVRKGPRTTSAFAGLALGYRRWKLWTQTDYKISDQLKLHFQNPGGDEFYLRLMWFLNQ